MTPELNKDEGLPLEAERDVTRRISRGTAAEPPELAEPEEPIIAIAQGREDAASSRAVAGWD